MQSHPHTTLLIAAATLAFGQAVLADSPPTVEQLRKQMAEMQTQMDNMRHRLDDDWLTERRAEAIRSLVHDVLADADTRASLLQNGLTAGWNGHPFIASADGAFRLQLEGQVQVRFVYNNQDAGADDTDRWGFENRRTKIKFGGHVFHDWKYKFNGAFGRDGGDLVLEDAYIEKNLGDSVAVRLGQFKGPFMGEELVSSSRQLAVDRSLVNERFNQDRSQGIQFTFKADQFQFMVMYNDGIKTANTMWETEDTEFAVTGRVEFSAMGDWGQFKDFTSKPGSDNALMIGIAGHYEKDEFGTASGPEEEVWVAKTSSGRLLGVG